MFSYKMSKKNPGFKSGLETILTKPNLSCRKTFGSVLKCNPYYWFQIGYSQFWAPFHSVMPKDAATSEYYVLKIWFLYLDFFSFLHLSLLFGCRNRMISWMSWNVISYSWFGCIFVTFIFFHSQWCFRRYP